MSVGDDKADTTKVRRDDSPVAISTAIDVTCPYSGHRVCLRLDLVSIDGEVLISIRRPSELLTQWPLDRRVSRGLSTWGRRPTWPIVGGICRGYRSSIESGSRSNSIRRNSISVSLTFRAVTKKSQSPVVQ